MIDRHLGVGLVIANDRLRDLVVRDLESSGFHVDFALREPGPTADADVVVTETSAVHGRLLTVRLTEAVAMPANDPAIVLDPDDLSALPDLIHHTLDGRVFP